MKRPECFVCKLEANAGGEHLQECGLALLLGGSHLGVLGAEHRLAVDVGDGGIASVHSNAGGGVSALLSRKHADLARGQRRNTAQVQLRLHAVDHDVPRGRRHHLEVGLLVVELLAPVVDLHTGNDGIVRLGSVNCLPNQGLQVAGDLTLADLGQLRQVDVFHLLLLLLNACCQALLEDGVLRVCSVVHALGLDVGLEPLSVELCQGAKHGTAGAVGRLLSGARHAADVALGVDGNVGGREKDVTSAAGRVGGEDGGVAEASLHAGNAAGEATAQAVDVKYQRVDGLDLLAQHVSRLVTAEVDDAN
mmetsp:Transcript_304/g.550  ORF Transcript_304/g.550 Transcript_304/m.550 type:complete len:306 (+) Transcript_304:82-999(+)